MRSKLLIGGLLASVMIIPALAQSNPPAPAAKSPAPAATAPAPAATTTTTAPAAHAAMWRASKLIGLNVYNEQNEKLGEASVVLLNDAGKPQGVVVKMREMDATQIEVVVPVDRIRDASRDKRLVIAATKEELKAMPRLQDQSLDPRANPGK